MDNTEFRSNGPAAEVLPSAPAMPTEDVSTRDRILDIALELFTDQGFEKTSLRQIAERLGFSKAAIYYHFASKDDILMALHLRLHEFAWAGLTMVENTGWSPSAWETLLGQLIDQMLEHRALFLLHERNRAALEALHRESHDAEHEDMEARLQEALASPDIALRDRVRMACAFGAVMGGLVLTGNVFSEVPSTELGGMLRDAVSDLMTPTADG